MEGFQIERPQKKLYDTHAQVERDMLVIFLHSLVKYQAAQKLIIIIMCQTTRMLYKYPCSSLAFINKVCNTVRTATTIGCGCISQTGLKEDNNEETKLEENDCHRRSK